MIAEVVARSFNGEYSGEYLIDARQYAADGMYTLSIRKYILYFSSTPKLSRAPNSEEEFVDLLCDIDIFFQNPDAISELIKCFLYSFLWFPKNPKLNNKFGIIMARDGEKLQSLRYVLRAYKFAGEQNAPRLGIEKNILHLMWSQVPRWQFRMLNGKRRNEAYKTAIHKALDKGYKNVADIGSGCGLLSLYAGIHQSRPSILAFEANPVLFKKGQKLIEKYCSEIEYKAYKIYSYDLKQLRQNRRDLLVTEIFDVAVFGEGILKSLKHAFKTILSKNFAIIPAAVTLYVTGITCEDLDEKYRLHKNHSIIGDNICATKSIEDDPYDAEILTNYQYEILTETNAFMRFTLTDEKAVDYFLSDKLDKTVILKAVKSGVLHALVLWFDLHLDEEIVVSTNPFHPQHEPCWEQAIFHCKHPVEICKDQTLQFAVTMKDEHLNFILWNAPKCTSNYCFELSEDALKFLNDEKWAQFVVSLSETIESDRKVVLDFCTFPLVGIEAAKKGHEVYHFYKDCKDLSFISRCLKMNGVDLARITFIALDNYPELLLTLNKVDYVMFEPVCQDGSLCPSPMDNIAFKKFKYSYLIQDILIHYVLIDSKYLDYSNRVDSENVQPFDELAKTMNEYTGTEHPYLPHDFPHEKMSNEQEWNFAQKPSTIDNLPILKDGRVNGILTWYTLRTKNGLEFSTKKSSYFHKSVLIFPEKKVEADEIVKMYCQYEDSGAFKIEICQEMWLRTNFERFTNNSYLAEFLEKNDLE